MIETNNLEKAKSSIRKNRKQEIRAQDLEFNRKIISYGNFSSLVFPSETKGKRKLKMIETQFDRVCAKDASKNNISITYDLSEISKLNKLEKAKELENLRKNIKIARKYKTTLVLKNIKDKKNSLSLMLSLSASTDQAKKSIDF